MTSQTRQSIFLVDDDAVFLRLLAAEFLAFPEFRVTTFSTGELCLQQLHLNPDFIVLDYHLDGITPDSINGIDTLDKIKAISPGTPVVMLSSQDSIDVAVRCMHHKAFDYVVKSETAFLRIHKNIKAFFQYEKMEKELNWYMSKM
ncbi:MAG: response regulator [Bacteroidetes bacterium]|nr:MAG: response regulator [Bacteroidota bacterium]